jgi:hypothetical protein
MQTLAVEGLERGLADVNLQEALEEPGRALEGAEDAVAKEWRAIHEEQGAGHAAGKALDAAVGLLVEGEVVGAERFGQRYGLAEAEGEAFAGDGIDGAGGVADEGDVGVGYTAEFAAERDGASRWAVGLGQGEAMAQGGEVTEGCLGAGEFFICDEGDADFMGGVGRDVGLTDVAPVDFDEVRPRGDGVVLAEADAARLDAGFGEAGPGGDAGAGTVGADEVAGAEGLAIAVDERAFRCGGDALDGVLPMEADAEAGGSVEEDLVEDGAADASSAWEWQRGRRWPQSDGRTL